MVIYLITNKVNGKYYVGQTTFTAMDRWESHKQDAKYSSNIALHRAIRKYGAHNFQVETLCSCPNRDALNEAEFFFILMLGACNFSFGYNCRTGGQHSLLNKEGRETLRQNKFIFWATKTESERKSMMAVANQTPWTDKRRQVLSDLKKTCYRGSGNPMFGVKRVSPFKGRNHPLVARKILSQRALDRYKATSLETRQQATTAGRAKLMELRKQRGGDLLSVEGKASLSESKKAFWASKTSEERRIILTPAYKAKKTFTDEAKKTCSEASKAYWTVERRLERSLLMKARNLARSKPKEG